MPLERSLRVCYGWTALLYPLLGAVVSLIAGSGFFSVCRLTFCIVVWYVDGGTCPPFVIRVPAFIL